MISSSLLTRRAWLALASAVPAFARPRVYTFRHDYVLGTSLDLTLTGVSNDQALAAEAAALATVERLQRVLDTRNPQSELRRGVASPDLQNVLDAYRLWEQRTGGVIRAQWGDSFNVDALGKAYIVDRAAEAARAAAPGATSILLDIGGDIRAFGPVSLGIADPTQPFDNGPQLTALTIQDRALATSGNYARGQHILDGRSGAAASGTHSASVTAPDCVTANALSLALCVLSPEEGLRLVESMQDSEALLVTSSGGVLRSSGFRRYEDATFRRAAYAGWTNGSQVSISITLTEPAPAGGGGFGGGGRFGGRGGGFGRLRRPYVAIWAEDSSGKVVRNIALWASKPRWLPELHTWWGKNGSASRQISQMARATRAAGQYSVSWNGMTDAGEAAPAGIYRIWIETNREHGSHYQESVTIDCSGKPASAAMKPTPEFEAKVEFGPVSGVV